MGEINVRMTTESHAQVPSLILLNLIFITSECRALWGERERGHAAEIDI